MSRAARASEWSISMCDCCNGKDVGPNCAVQQTCVQPCVWASALERAGVPDAGLLACLLCCGGRGVLDEFAAYVGRRALAARYGIVESPARTCVLVCCCGPCARCQEIDTVMTREKLSYGCARLEADATNARVTRSVAVRPSTMRR